MTINELSKKLVKNNISQYYLLIFSITISVTMVTSLSLIIFSPVIQSNITKGGGVYDQAISALILSLICCMLFVLYANILFMKYKSREVGVFLSLGMTRKNIIKILIRELVLIFPLSIVLGILLSIPFTYFFWQVVCNILNITLPLKLSMGGVLIGFATGFSMMLFQRLAIRRYINKSQIMKLIAIDKAPEMKFSENKYSGILYLVLTIVCVICWYLSTSSIMFPNVKLMPLIFASFTIIFLYFTMKALYTFGNLLRKIKPSIYYSNIIFYSFLRVKNRQYTNAFFSVIILVGITIFMSISSFIPILALDEISDVLNPTDFSFRKTFDQNNEVDNQVIYDIADKSGISIYDLHQVNYLVLARQELDGYYWEMVVIDEKEYSERFDEDIDVEQGHFVMISPNKLDASRSIYDEIEGFSVGSEFSLMLERQAFYHEVLFVGGAAARGEYFILDSSDYNLFSKNSKATAFESHVSLKVSDWINSERFYNDLNDYLTGSNENGLKIRGSIIEQYYDGIEPVFVAPDQIKESDIYNSNYTLSARVKGRIYKTQRGIFSMLFVHIAIMSFIFSSTILYVKVVNTSWRDKSVLDSLLLLGERTKKIKSIITKQLLLIYGVTSLLGVGLGILITSLTSWGYLFSSIYIKYSILIACSYLVIQLCIFTIVRHIKIRERIKFIMN